MPDSIALDIGEGVFPRKAGIGLAALDEGPVAEVVDRLLKFGVGVHHDRTIPSDRLLEQLPGHQQKPDAFLACLDSDLVAAVEQDQLTIAGLLPDENFIVRRAAFGQNPRWVGGVTE